MRIDVDTLMADGLSDWLAGQSTMRAEARDAARKRWLLGGGVSLFGLLWIWINSGWSSPFALFLTAVAAIAVGIFGYLPIAEATKTIKIGINSAIARAIGIEYSHEAEAGPEFKLARAFRLVPSFNRRGLEDRWFGLLEGHRFNLYEAHLEQRRGSNKEKRWVTVFRGAIIDMDFGRSFHSTTLLQRAGQHRKWLGMGGRKDDIHLGGKNLALVDQVHPDFEDLFDVYSTDQVEARVLVHPSYIEHLIALETAFRGEKMRAIFHKGRVVIAIESGNLFESGAIDGARDRERVEEAAQQFGSLARLALAINQGERGRSMGQASMEQAGPTDARDAGSSSDH